MYGGSGSLSSTIEPPTKKKKVGGEAAGGDSDWMASDVADIRDVDLEVYGREDTSATSRISSYTFEARKFISGGQIDSCKVFCACACGKGL